MNEEGFCAEKLYLWRGRDAEAQSRNYGYYTDRVTSNKLKLTEKMFFGSLLRSLLSVFNTIPSKIILHFAGRAAGLASTGAAGSRSVGAVYPQSVTTRPQRVARRINSLDVHNNNHLSSRSISSDVIPF